MCCPRKELIEYTEYHLHEFILALWGMPLGEMLDLEKLAQTCREKNRWTFFFTAAPANVPGEFFVYYDIFVMYSTDVVAIGGVSTHVNGTAIF
jgi:hypothetical protein